MRCLCSSKSETQPGSGEFHVWMLKGLVHRHHAAGYVDLR